MKLKDSFGSCLNIFQESDGAIYLTFGHAGVTKLTKKQIHELGIRGYLYDIEGFDQSLFNEAYWEGVWGLYEKGTGLIIDTSLCVRSLEVRKEQLYRKDESMYCPDEYYEIKKVYQHTT